MVRSDKERETVKSCKPLELDDKTKEKQTVNEEEKDRLFGVYREYYQTRASNENKIISLEKEIKAANIKHLLEVQMLKKVIDEL